MEIMTVARVRRARDFKWRRKAANVLACSGSGGGIGGVAPG